MLSFELSLLILLMAVIVLLIFYILYVTEPPTEPPAEEKLSVEEKIPPRKPTATATGPKEGGKKLLSPEHQADSAKCPHDFGYLKKRDKNTPIPDECLSCPRMMECLSSGE